MADDIFSKIDPAAIPQLDLSYAYDMMTGVQAEIDANNRRTMEMANQAYENRQKMKNAMEQTAANTAEANDHLRKVIANQNELIDWQKEQLVAQKEQLATQKSQLEAQTNEVVMLQAQLETLSKQLEVQRGQLDILNNIFASGEDGVMVEKEIMKLIQEQIDENHPLWDYAKDKGGDLAVAGATAGIPILYNAFKAFMLSQGIMLP